MTAVFAVLGVALFSATPAVRWCSVTWADVRPECFVTCSDRTTCAAAKSECQTAGARAVTAGATCAARAGACNATPSADAVTASLPAPETPLPAPTPESGKRAFCIDGVAGGPGEPGPMLDVQAAPAKARALAPPAAPKLQPLTVHRILANVGVAPRPPNRPGALPPSPRAPPRNVFLQSVY